MELIECRGVGGRTRLLNEATRSSPVEEGVRGVHEKGVLDLTVEDGGLPFGSLFIRSDECVESHLREGNTRREQRRGHRGKKHTGNSPLRPVTT